MNKQSTTKGYVTMRQTLTCFLLSMMLMCIGVVVHAQVPSNDDPVGAINLTVNADLACGVTTAGTTVGATQTTSVSESPGGSCGPVGATNDDVWYTFTATQTAHQITLTGTTGTAMNTAIYTGAPGSLVLVSCSGSNTSNFYNLTPGTQYYVRIYTYAPAAATTSAFNICVGTGTNMAYVSNVETQLPGSVVAGSANQQMMRIIVNVSGVYNPLTFNSMTFDVTGTTNPADILRAKLYYNAGSGSLNLATATLIGSPVLTPTGSYTISGSVPLLGDLSANTANNFYLAYDLACNATASNVLDATISNINLSGTNYTPTTSAPTQSRAITATPNTRVSTKVNNTVSVKRNDVNMAVAKAQISGCAEDVVTSITFNTLGSTNAAADISSAKVYYTTVFGTFSTAVPFGSAMANPNGSITFTGSQALGQTTGYFWLAYDIASNATIGNVADGHFESVVLNNGATLLPTSYDSAGNRPIVATPMSITSLEAQQGPGITPGNMGGGDIDRAAARLRVVVTDTASPLSLTSLSFNFNGTTNLSEVTNARVYYGSTVNNWTMGAPYNVPFGTATVSPTGTVTVTGSQVLTANADGTPTNNYFWLVFDAPCNVTTGNVIDAEITSATIGTAQVPSVTAPAGNINVINPTTNATLQPSVAGVYKNSVNNAVLRMRPTRCASATGTVTAIYFSTSSSTNAANDIVNAKVYYTTISPAFNPATNTLFGTTATPAGNFVVTGSVNIPVNGSNFYLAYDIAPGAIVGDSVDAKIDSMIIDGVAIVAPIGNPDGGRKILPTPMHVDSLMAQQSAAINPAFVAGGDVNRAAIRLRVLAADTANPLSVTSITYNFNGTTNAADVTNARIYYGGSTAAFNPSNIGGSYVQFGAATAAPGTGSVTLTGSQLLSVPATGAATNNYFWLVYDLPCSAMNGTLDAEITAVTIGSPMTPTVTAPAGNSTVQNPNTLAVTQPLTTPVAKGSVDNQILRLRPTRCATATGTVTGNRPISNTPLSIKLLKFEGVNRNPVNDLTWTTAMEKDFSHFELQRSDDGNVFNSLDRIQGKNVETGSTYDYTDKQPIEGKNYYRLIMVNNDGSSFVSDVVMLVNKTASTLTLSVHPNPVTELLQVNLAGKVDGKATIQLVDIVGKVIKTFNLNGNNMSIDMNNMPAGTYIVRYQDNSNKFVTKVVKTN